MIVAIVILGVFVLVELAILKLFDERISDLEKEISKVWKWQDLEKRKTLEYIKLFELNGRTRDSVIQLAGMVRDIAREIRGIDPEDAERIMKREERDEEDRPRRPDPDAVEPIKRKK